jgi:hypothetical protein
MVLVDGVGESADMISPGEIDPGEINRIIVRCHPSPHLVVGEMRAVAAKSQEWAGWG